MRIIFTGGGTGGHVVPNIAVIKELIDRFEKKGNELEILYIGSKEGIEKKMIEEIGVDYVGVSTGKLRRYFSWENFKDFLRVPKGIFEARKVIKEFKPDVVFSKGGFVGVPVTVGAWISNVPVVLHESDLVPGLANKIAFRFCKKICLSFEESKSFLRESFLKKAVLTGNPVRKRVFDGCADRARKLLGFDRYRPVILVMGGSQGAKQINELVFDSLEELKKRYQIVHLVGKGNLRMDLSAIKGYRQFEFLKEELFDVYALCEVVISRGGANSLAEIAALGSRAVILPLGKDVSRGDQIDNAKVFAERFGWSVLEGKIKAFDFVKAVDMCSKGEKPEVEFKSGTGNVVEVLETF